MNDRPPFRHVPANILAFCRGAQICPTGCDDDCEADCHESHTIPVRRGHQPDECPSAERSAP